MLITTFGNRRVGNHLIRRWISPNFSKPTHIFLNQHQRVRPVTEPPLDEVATLGVEDGTYRDLLYKDDCNSILRASTHYIHIIRDPINSLASALKATHKFRSQHSSILGAPSPTILIPAKFSSFLETPPEGHLVIYEKFLASKEYRDNLATSLGIRPYESELDKLSPQLGGSSFTGFTVPANQMPVNERWKECIDDPTYLWYLRYPGLLEARESVYGPLPTALQERLNG